MKNNRIKERFVELRVEGLSYSLISKRLGVAKTTLLNWNGELEEEIQQLKDERIDTIRAKYKLYRESQLERYGKWLKKIEKELQSRDFSKIKTDRLLEIAMKLMTETTNNTEADNDSLDKSKAITPEQLEAIARGDCVVVG